MSDTLDVVPTRWYEAELLALSNEDQARVERRVAMLRRRGWKDSVTDRSIKHLRDGIHELRVLGRGAAFRVLFFVVPGRSPRVVVLTACAAKSLLKKRARLDAEIERAKSRRAAWLNENRKEGSDDRR